MTTRRIFLRLVTAASTASIIPDFFQDDPVDQLREQSEDAIDDFLRDADSEAVAEDIATVVCTEHESLGDTITIDEVDRTPESIREDLKQSEAVLEVLEENLGTTFETNPSKIIAQADDLAKPALDLVPVLASIKSVIDNGCTLHNLLEDTNGSTVSNEKQEDIEEAKENLLISCGTLIIQIAAVNYSVTYKISFRATRFLANQLLVHIRGLVGLRLYAMLLREVHWELRSQSAMVVGHSFEFIVNKTKELKQSAKELKEADEDSIYDDAFESDDLERLNSITSIDDLKEKTWVEKILDGLFGG